MTQQEIEHLQAELAALKIYKPAAKATRTIASVKRIAPTNYQFWGIDFSDSDVSESAA